MTQLRGSDSLGFSEGTVYCGPETVDPSDLSEELVSAMNSGYLEYPFGNCKICKDKATGIHYGVASCEGCKGFFKRTMLRRSKHHCFFGGRCPITPLTRTRCKACRYKRCLQTGMSLTAMKMGRIPAVEKERALAQAQQKTESHTGSGPDPWTPALNDHTQTSDMCEPLPGKQRRISLTQGVSDDLKSALHVTDSHADRREPGEETWVGQRSGAPIAVIRQHPYVPYPVKFKPPYPNSDSVLGGYVTAAQPALGPEVAIDAAPMRVRAFPSSLPDAVPLSASGPISLETEPHQDVQEADEKEQQEAAEEAKGSLETKDWVRDTCNKLTEVNTGVEGVLELMKTNVNKLIQGNRLNTLKVVTEEDAFSFWQELFNGVAVANKNIIGFCNALPGFKNLDSRDQETLLKKAYFDVWIVTNTDLYWNDDFYIMTPNGARYTKQWMLHFLPQDLVASFASFSEVLAKLGISRLVRKIMCALCLTTLHENLSNGTCVHTLHSHYIDVLNFAVTEAFGARNGIILSEIYKLLSMLKCISKQMADVVGSFNPSKLPERCLERLSKATGPEKASRS